METRVRLAWSSNVRLPLESDHGTEIPAVPWRSRGLSVLIALSMLLL